MKNGKPGKSERAAQRLAYKFGLVDTPTPPRGKARRELEEAYRTGDTGQKFLYVATKAGKVSYKLAKSLFKKRNKKRKSKKRKKSHKRGKK